MGTQIVAPQDVKLCLTDGVWEVLVLPHFWYGDTVPSLYISYGVDRVRERNSTSRRFYGRLGDKINMSRGYSP